jgi:hypothetical protein
MQGRADDERHIGRCGMEVSFMCAFGMRASNVGGSGL